MIKPEQVPDEVLNAAAKNIPEVDMEDYSQYWSETLRVAIAAALSAWPGVRKPMRVNGLQSECWLELPLSQQETRDD